MNGWKYISRVNMHSYAITASKFYTSNLRSDATEFVRTWFVSFEFYSMMLSASRSGLYIYDLDLGY